MTKLEAVNYLLGVLGSSSVGSLSNTNPDVDVCEAALDNAITAVTSKGFWFNEVYNVVFTPDPLDANKIDTTGYLKLITRNVYGVVRGNNYLFDPKNNTYVWGQTVTADGVALLTWEELPTSVQLAVQYYAASHLCSVELEDSTKLDEQTGFYKDSYVQVLNEDLEIKRRNAQNTPRALAALRRVHPGRLAGRSGPNFGGR